MKQYALGFVFNANQTEVLLIRKLKPEWQKNKLNGIGGKQEEGESPHFAMMREFKEEAGVVIPIWEHCITLTAKDEKWRVFIWRAFMATGIENVKPQTEELIYGVKTNRIPRDVIPNLRWIIPMLMDNLKFPIKIIDKGYGE